MKKIYYLLLVCFAFTACQKSSVDKKQEDVIRYKETVQISDVPRATLTFFEVEDSRCPEGVQCIWAGEASIDLALEGVSTEGKMTRHVKMCFGTCSNFQADTLDQEFAGEKYQFILKSVTPTPKADTQVNKLDYAISLSIKQK
jgi:hypothetical protein